MQTTPLFSLSSTSPSLSGYSSVNLAEIAARVIDELRNEEPRSDDDWRSDGNNAADDHDCDGGQAFEFVCQEPESEPAVTADEIFCNGQIRPVYPYTLLNSGSGGGDSGADGTAASETKPAARHRRPALRKLMSEERDSASCSSSEGDDELSGVSPEIYCMWTPKRSNDHGDGLCSPSRSKIKSNSTGSSKRWKFRDLLYVRSSSEGKLFLSPSKKSVKPKDRSTGGEEKSAVKSSGGEENTASKGQGGESPKRQPSLPCRKG